MRITYEQIATHGEDMNIAKRQAFVLDCRSCACGVLARFQSSERASVLRACHRAPSRHSAMEEEHRRALNVRLGLQGLCTESFRILLWPACSAPDAGAPTAVQRPLATAHSVWVGSGPLQHAAGCHPSVDPLQAI